MTTVCYDLRPINQRARKILPTLKPPGAMPTTPADSPLTVLDDTPEIATFEVSKLDNFVLRTVRSCSDVVRASSPWFGLRASKEKSTELVSVAYNTPVYQSESVEDVNRLLSVTLPPAPSEAGPDSESDESDDDGRPWITGTREPHKEAERRLTTDKRERVNRRTTKIHTRAESPAQEMAGPLKGKATDPREWGAAGLVEEDLNVDAQRAAFEAWNAERDARDVTSEGDSESGTERVPEVVESIKVSKQELERLVQEQAAEVIRAAEARIERKYEKKIRELNRKLDQEPAKERDLTKEGASTSA
ncbi:hypothetical protein EV702DRAFT_1234349 [Suillus placidus]|uniref:Uncharacterized protein n=1 Tax=Suillus placidus TaxID=48579 RepID=A0A9P6ZRV9_9AGAM|nr:hypothetical protein EV702DRAFT_1234349 [Suillus placidus]